jgi:hypothetical protein
MKSARRVVSLPWSAGLPPIPGRQQRMARPARIYWLTFPAVDADQPPTICPWAVTARRLAARTPVGREAMERFQALLGGEGGGHDWALSSFHGP